MLLENSIVCIQSVWDDIHGLRRFFAWLSEIVAWRVLHLDLKVDTIGLFAANGIEIKTNHGIKIVSWYGNMVVIKVIVINLYYIFWYIITYIFITYFGTIHVVVNILELHIHSSHSYITSHSFLTFIYNFTFIPHGLIRTHK